MESVAESIAQAHLVSGVILNSLLIYLIYRFSRSSVGTYKYLLAIFAAYDLYLCVLHQTTKPAIVIVGTATGAVTDTPFESRHVTCVYVGSFAVPFALLMIHFLYRYWSIRRPHLIVLFSNKKFIAGISMLPTTIFVVWYVLSFSAMRGDDADPKTQTLQAEYTTRYGKVVTGAWIVLDIWEGEVLDTGSLIASGCFNVIMSVSFSAEKLSPQAHILQRKLFIAVCAQTFVPLVFVYTPYGIVIDFPIFNLPIFALDKAWNHMTACFPAWDAVIIIVLIRDYRDGLVTMLSKKKPPPAESVWMTNTTGIPSNAPSSQALPAVA